MDVFRTFHHTYSVANTLFAVFLNIFTGRTFFTSETTQANSKVRCKMVAKAIFTCAEKFPIAKGLNKRAKFGQRIKPFVFLSFSLPFSGNNLEHIEQILAFCIPYLFSQNLSLNHCTVFLHFGLVYVPNTVAFFH